MVNKRFAGLFASRLLLGPFKGVEDCEKAI
jgi:hypothetical protein